MKKFKDISEFEKLVKTQLENHSTPPPPKVWDSMDISSIEQASSKTLKIIELIKNPIQAVKIAAIVGASVTALFLVIKNQDSPSNNNSISKNTYSVVVDSTLNTQSESLENKNRIYENKPLSKSSNNTANFHQTIVPKNTKETERQTAQTNDFIESSEQPNVIQTTQKLVISNNQPCIGETIIISSNNKGDWYLNNKLIDENTDNIEHTINLDKSLLIAFKNEFGEEQEIINVINSEYQIITKKIDLNTFAFTLSNQEINVNWYLDDSLVAENENTCKITEYRVGEHEIKSVPANSKCISKSSTIFNIGSIGSIKFFNVFTPNGDGTNDEYSVEINNYENYRIIIYDQVKNQIIFTSNTPDNRWNGSINNTGQDCPPGEYLAKINYTLKGEKPQTKNIKFTLIRP